MYRYHSHCKPSMYAFAWFASSNVAGLAGRRCARRGRVPTASSAADGAPLLLMVEDNLWHGGASATAGVMAAARCAKVGHARHPRVVTFNIS